MVGHAGGDTNSITTPTNWYERLTRTIHHGFHSLELNALQFKRVAPPPHRTELIFRDLFNRDNALDINAGVAASEHWTQLRLHPNLPDPIHAALYQTSIQLSNPERTRGLTGLLQAEPSPAGGIVLYATRVSITTGTGSHQHAGVQEAGLLLLAEPSSPSEFNATFVGVGFDSHHPVTKGRIHYRVGNGRGGYRTNLKIPDVRLPMDITEGEYEIIVKHDVPHNVLRHIRINNVDITPHLTEAQRTQRLTRGLYGIRSAIENTDSHVQPKQHYWYYGVESLLPNSDEG